MTWLFDCDMQRSPWFDGYTLRLTARDSRDKLVRLDRRIDERLLHASRAGADAVLVPVLRAAEDEMLGYLLENATALAPPLGST